jgi:putative methyltransferase (TIGR04325 family)
MNPRNVAKLLLPPIVLEGWRIIQSRQGRDFDLIGNYSSWNEALRASTGYDTELILEKTKAALLNVKNGEAIYERDSVLFNEIQYTWPLLAGLMWVAAQSHGRLNVLDFGGSLGSTYYQNRAFLPNLPEVRWNIIEQSAHVKVGKEYFEDEVLKFFPNIEICLSETKPNVVLLSSVLQYLEDPYDMLNKLLDLSCEYVIIDRTPFWEGSSDRLCVQKVPPSIYPASYPSWIFAKEKFLHQIAKKDYEVIADFENLDHLSGPVEFTYRGMIISRERALKK